MHKTRQAIDEQQRQLEGEKVQETNLSFILLTVLHYQLGNLEDAYQNKAKSWFNTLFKSAQNLYYTLDSAMRIDKHYSEGKWFYSEKTTFLYDAFRLLVDAKPENHKIILETLKKQLQNEKTDN